MGLEHVSLPLYGVQFHPESVCSEHGLEMVASFLRRTTVQLKAGRLRSCPPAAGPEAARGRGGQLGRSCRHLLVCDLSFRLPSRLDAAAVFSTLFDVAPLAFWLDAREPPRAPSRAGEGRFSYMGSGGGAHAFLLRQRTDGRLEKLRAMGGLSSSAEVEVCGDVASSMRESLAEWEGASTRPWPAGRSLPRDDVEAALNAELQRPAQPADQVLPEELSFRCGFAGVFGYEAWHCLGPTADATELQQLKRHAQRRPLIASAADPEDTACFLFADRLIAIDHAETGAPRVFLLCLCDEGVAGSVASAARWLTRTTRALESLAQPPPPSVPSPAPPTPPSAPPPPPSVPAAPSRPSSLPAQVASPARVRFAFERGKEEYLGNIEAIHAHLCAGSTYEVCLTNKCRSTSHSLPPLALYSTICALNPAPHAAYMRLDPHRLRDANGGADSFGPGGLAMCSSSPERFLRVTRGGRVECKPIKGTAPRGLSADADRALAEALASGEKERAENLMIADLIRNDLSRVCLAGSVVVPSLMKVETFASVHQLVSTIHGQLDTSRFGALDAVSAAFPPGSMTGAPKVRTMSIIDELERGAPRGVYSGTLGYFSIDGAADLSVVIRTAVVDRAGVSVGAGGAITVLSDAEAEWQEVLLKASPLMRAIAICACGDPDAFDIASPASTMLARPPTHPTPPSEHPIRPAQLVGPSQLVGSSQLVESSPRRHSTCESLLVETMLHTPSHGFFLWDWHIRRLLASARALGFLDVGSSTGALAATAATAATAASVDAELGERLRQELDAHARQWPPEPSRVRLMYSADGQVQVARSQLPGPGFGAHPPIALDLAVLLAAPLHVARLDSAPVSSADARLQHKSSERDVYDMARARVGVAASGPHGPPTLDVLMFNEAGELTECSVANIAMQDAHGQWRTPPIDCGLLAGTMRAALLQTGALYEAVITLEDLQEAVQVGHQLIGFNSVRGVYRLRVDLQGSCARDMPATTLQSRL